MVFVETSFPRGGTAKPVKNESEDGEIAAKIVSETYTYISAVVYKKPHLNFLLFLLDLFKNKM